MNEDAPAPVSIEQVLQTLQAATSYVNEIRIPADATLRAWEADAAPGFLISLLRIGEQHAAIDESTRLMAVVVAKNAVGASWRKLMGTREWSRVPDEEKAAVRDAALQLLLTDPSDRIATQLAILITNIARFDFPTQWPQLVSNLLLAARMESAFPLQSKLRALRALKPLFRGLVSKRFSPVEAPRSNGIFTLADMKTMTERMQKERLHFKQLLWEATEPVQAAVLLHTGAFVAGADNWQTHGVFAKAAITALSELLHICATRADALPDGTKQVLEAIHTTSSAIAAGTVQGLDPSKHPAWAELGGLIYERMLRCVISYLDTFPLPFAEFVPFFMSLYVQSALIATDAVTLRRMRSKRRVLLVRFIARTLLCPFYRPEWLEDQARFQRLALQATAVQRVGQVRLKAVVVGSGGSSSGGPPSPVSANIAKVGQAQECLSALLSPAEGRCRLLVEAIISKYVALTPEELEEWSSDPESYARAMDVEAGPEADSPRPIGLGLLLCMLERGEEPVAAALKEIAGALLSVPNPTAESILMREACYRCIGEGIQNMQAYFDFNDWYNFELKLQLQQQLPAFLNGTATVIDGVLQTCALWLVGACATELAEDKWSEAYELSCKYMSSKDLVVALTAVTTLSTLTNIVIDESRMLDQLKAIQRERRTPGLAAGRHLQLQIAEAQLKYRTPPDELQARVATRLSVLGALLPATLHACFSLLGQLSEMESMVRLLHLVSCQVDVLGQAAAPHLGAIASALPTVWNIASGGSGQQRRPDADTGSVVRLHSALIAVLTHLVVRLRGAALGNTQVRGVVFPLLQFATKLSSPESEVLVDEAFKLWVAVLGTQPEVSPEMMDLIPNMAAILRRGKDNAQIFGLVEAYMILGAGAGLQQHSAAIAAALHKTIGDVTQAVLNSTAPPRPPQQQAATAVASPSGRPAPVAFSMDSALEGQAAASLCDVMLQLHPNEAPTLLYSSLQALAGLLSHEQVPIHLGSQAGLNMKIFNVMECFLEALSRMFLHTPQSFATLTENNPQVQGRLVDRWLFVASTSTADEIMGLPIIIMLARFRRRMVAVAMCVLLATGVLQPAALNEDRIVRICSALLQALMEETEFQGDVLQLNTLDFKEDLGEDYIASKRLELSRNDAVRSINLRQSALTAVRQLSDISGGEAAFLALCSTRAPGLVKMIQLVLHDKMDLMAAQLEADSAEEDDDDEEQEYEGIDEEAQ